MGIGDRYALVTGATSGIGEAICLSLAREHCSIIIHYNSNDIKANALKERIISEYNVKFMTIKCNLESDEDINN